MLLRELFESSKLLDKPTPTVGELAKKYGVSTIEVHQQLKKGKKVELEHTSDTDVAREIALDHLSEDLYYYVKLAQVEKDVDECSDDPDCDCECDDEITENPREVYMLKLHRAKDYDTLYIKSNLHPSWVEVRGKPDYETRGYDPYNELHQVLDALDPPTVAALMTGEVITLNNKNPRTKPAIDVAQQILDVNENFADGKGPGRPGDSQRHGIPKKASMSTLKKAAHAKGRKGQLARWQINMRNGRKKHKHEE